MPQKIRKISSADIRFMRAALRLAEMGFGSASPNPMVGAVIVAGGKIIGRGWHRGAGLPHAEIEALENARHFGRSSKGAAMYVTLEPCSTFGRTPPCVTALIDSGVARVVVGATDPNPSHQGAGFARLRQAGIEVRAGVLEQDCVVLNTCFNYWIVHREPLVTVKAAMTLDGKIATAAGESKWITGPLARVRGMHLRQSADAILVGVNTIIADDPSLTWRPQSASEKKLSHPLRRIVLDTHARIPPRAKVLSDSSADLTTVVVGEDAPAKAVQALERRVRVLRSPLVKGRINLRWLVRKLGAEEITHLLVEGGGEVNGSFFQAGLVHQVAFFYAPKIFGGQKAPRAVAGIGVARAEEMVGLTEVKWEWLGPDLLLTARCENPRSRGQQS